MTSVQLHTSHLVDHLVYVVVLKGSVNIIYPATLPRYLDPVEMVSVINVFKKSSQQMSSHRNGPMLILRNGVIIPGR